MNKQIIFGLLLVGVLLNVVPPLQIAAAEEEDNNPYTMQWWYQARKTFMQPEPLDKGVQHNDGDDDDNDDNDSSDERLDKKYCASPGYWNGQKCVIDDPEEKAAYEDAVCDEPKDTKKYKDVCGGGGGSSIDDDFTNREHLSADTEKEKKWSEYVAQVKKANPQYFAPDKKETNPAEETGPTGPIYHNDDDDDDSNKDKGPEDDAKPESNNDNDSHNGDGDKKDSDDDGGGGDKNDDDNKDNSGDSSGDGDNEN